MIRLKKCWDEYDFTLPGSSGVASPKIWEGPKNLGGAKCLILGK